MSKLRLSEWLGLYALLPLMVALMVIDDDADYVADVASHLVGGDCDRRLRTGAFVG